MIGPGPTFAMLRLILLALLPQIGGIVMMSGGSFPRDVDRRRSTDAASAEDHPRRNAGAGWCTMPALQGRERRRTAAQP
jgi:hypothetical protein